MAALANRPRVEATLAANPNWLVWKEEAQLDDSKLKGEVAWIDIIQIAFQLNPIGIVMSSIGDALSRGWTSAGNGLEIFTALTSGKDIELQSWWAQTYNEETLSLDTQIAKGYVRALPLIALSASEEVKDILEDSIFGNLIGGITGDSNLPAIANTQTRLVKAVVTSGYFGPHPWLSALPFFLEPDTFNTLEVQDLDLSVNSEGALVNTSVSTQATVGYKTKPVSYAASIIDAIPSGVASHISHLFSSNEELLEQAGIPLPGSAFVWDIEEGIELEKVRYFKQLLSRLADMALGDPGVLRAFGLEGLAYVDRNEFLKGKEAYPDLELPYHPYYGDTY